LLEALARIDRALEALPAKARETFLMARFDALRYADDCQLCCIDPGNAWTLHTLVQTEDRNQLIGWAHRRAARA